jgi:hypothetical protein
VNLDLEVAAIRFRWVDETQAMKGHHTGRWIFLTGPVDVNDVESNFMTWAKRWVISAELFGAGVTRVVGVRPVLPMELVSRQMF